jgi:hypothetical protein
MYRFRNRVLNGLMILLLLLPAAATVRSYWISDDWIFQNYNTKDGKTTLFCATGCDTRGTVEIAIESGHVGSIAPQIFNLRHFSLPPDTLIFQTLRRTPLERLGFRFARGQLSFVHGIWAPGSTTAIVDLPVWFLTIAFAALPLMWIAVLRRRSNVPANHCHSCGYDLRATPDRCPECGTVPPQKEPTQN